MPSPSVAPLDSPVALVGVGEMGGVFSRALLRAGHPVYPVVRSGSAETVANALPDPSLALVTVGEADLPRLLPSLPERWMGRAGLINSGGASGKNDLAQAVKTAVINKRAGGMGLISGRKAFQKPMDQGVQLLNAIQDVYLCDEITVA